MSQIKLEQGREFRAFVQGHWSFHCRPGWPRNPCSLFASLVPKLLWKGSPGQPCHSASAGPLRCLPATGRHSRKACSGVEGFAKDSFRVLSAPLAQNGSQKELGRQLPFVSSPFVPLMGLHPRTRKLDSFNCLRSLTGESIKRQGMFCSVTRLCLQLKQALKNARGSWSAGRSQQSNCVTERIRGPLEDLAGMINGGQYSG